MKNNSRKKNKILKKFGRIKKVITFALPNY